MKPSPTARLNGPWLPLSRQRRSLNAPCLQGKKPMHSERDLGTPKPRQHRPGGVGGGDATSEFKYMLDMDAVALPHTLEVVGISSLSQYMVHAAHDDV
mmetsp:Transcript_26257/g.79717  ORF Transcript_26257/g.79717 Transcript_26257/m.79717 type:complete len:98 (-) Transcript_26257:490-783(-)